MGSKFVSNSPQVIMTGDMEIGQVGVITDSHSYTGCILLKCFDVWVCIYDPKNNRIGQATWKKPSFKIRLLEKGEHVILSND